jgi:hypothetical protein
MVAPKPVSDASVKNCLRDFDMNSSAGIIAVSVCFVGMI